MLKALTCRNNDSILPTPYLLKSDSSQNNWINVCHCAWANPGLKDLYFHIGSTDGKILLRWGSHAIEKHNMITKHCTPSCWHTSSLDVWNFMEAKSYPRKVWKVCRLIVSGQVRSTRHVGTVQVWLHWMGGGVSWKHMFSKVWLHAGTFVSSGEFIVQFPGTGRKRSIFRGLLKISHTMAPREAR